jgi:hypothetical protein
MSDRVATSTSISTELRQDLQDWRKNCNKCQQFTAADFNDLRQHKEQQHGTCAYCWADDLNLDDYLDHVIKAHRYLCVWCHLAGFYAPPTSGISREVEHMKKFHPRKIKPKSCTLDDFL